MKRTPSSLSPTMVRDALETNDDFGFELRVRAVFDPLGWRSSHGGTYIDPVTNKPRQFDLRAENDTSDGDIIFLAVECKNIPPHRPIVVSTVSRTEEEAYHHVFSVHPIGRRQNEGMHRWQIPLQQQYVEVAHGGWGLYAPDKPVGKTLAQWSFDENGRGQPLTKDDPIYDRWAQAVASSCDLVRTAYERVRESAWKREAWICSAVIPVLVVPDETLWTAHYDDKGVLAGDPVRSDHLSLYLGRTLPINDAPNHLEFSLSHLEIVTVSGLRRLASMDPAEEGVAGIFVGLNRPRRLQG